jgi:hypothetical protein
VPDPTVTLPAWRSLKDYSQAFLVPAVAASSAESTGTGWASGVSPPALATVGSLTA